MGSPKALLVFRAETFLDRLIAIFSAWCDPVIVVLGHQPEAIQAGLRRARQATFVVNPHHSLGQLSSMQCGLREIPDQAQGVLFTLVDHPNVSAETVQSLLEERHKHPEALFSIPVFRGRKGHPIYFSTHLISEFLALPPGGEARTVVRKYSSETRYVDVQDGGILDDVDDPAAYEALVNSFKA
ncbi:MAG: nucleotidyltransferase family protein [Acidobacteriota bacterium]|nr:nucleotidyltransferase family protein [Acidobacteriota bacterium]